MIAAMSEIPSQKPPDWARVERVLLDMDGTVLDLAFDNRFWRDLVPARYAEQRGLTYEQAYAELEPRFRALQGTLEWYCLDYWSWVTSMHLPTLKREVRGWIAPLQGAEDFLRAVRDSGRELWLVTNAHHGSWSLKLEHTGFLRWFDRVVCSHDFGAPKEDARFWQRFAAAHPFVRERALFADDSLAVLRAARAFGIGELVAMRRPDSRQPAREIAEFFAVERLADLLPIRQPVKTGI